MKEIFQEYGGIIITVVAILALIVVIVAVIGDSSSGTVGQAFTNLIQYFLDTANTNAGITVSQ
jgi:hypothetical protein